MTDVVVDVRVIPRAKKTQLAGVREGAVLIRLAAPPVEGAANDALIEFLATTLDIPQRQIKIVSGEHTRHKRVSIAGASADAVRSRLGV
jgi:uncharacterized protein (TIGR00251 family)